VTIVFTAAVVEPRAEGVPAIWQLFVERESAPALWHGGVMAGLAWNASRPSYLGVVADGGGSPLAIFHVQHVGARVWRRRFVDRRSTPVAGAVECRHVPLRSGTGYRFAAGLDARERRAALSVFERAIAARLGRRASAIVYRNVPPADLALFGRRALRRRVMPEVVVDNRWGDVGEFYAALPAKRRSHLRRLDQALAGDPDLVIGDENRLEPACASRLAASVARRHRRRAGGPTLPVSYFEALSACAGVEFLTYRERDGRLLAFATLVDDGSELSDWVWGSVDIADGGRPDLYFHHYLRAVEHLIGRRRRRIVLGKGLGEIKLRYAGRYEDRYVVGAAL
jgi:hypothetical protein